MNTSLRQWLTGLVLASLCVFSLGARAQNTEPPAPPAPPAAQAPADAPAPANPAPNVEAPAVEKPDVEAADTDAAEKSEEAPSARDLWREKWWGRRDWASPQDDVVSVGSDSHLEKGRTADTVVSVFGSSTSEGDVRDAVVSIFGDNHVSGTVGDSAVAVFGDNHVNAKVYGDVVAVMGDIELGPEAEVNGEVVVIGGTLTRDPQAVVHGGVQRVLGHSFGSFRWLRPWVQHCLLLGRPLALAGGLGWAWGLAFGFLALYAFIAFLFRSTVDRCVATLETRPGQTVVASLIGLLVTPVLFALLFITVIGIAFIPFAAAAMFVATMFGKVVVLAWIGRSLCRAAGESRILHTALCVVLGGAVILVLYLVPVIGFIVYKALGILGFGVSVYAVILAVRARRGEAAPPVPPTSESGPGGGSPAFGSEPYISGTPGSAAFTGGPDASANFAAASDSTAPRIEGIDEGAGTSEGISATGASSAAAPGDTVAPPGAASPSSSSAGGGVPGGPANPAPGGAAAAPPPGPARVAAAVAPTLPKADFVVRMGALLIDVIIIALLLHAIRGGHDAQLIALATYGAIMWKVKGTTIGGIVFGIQVVRADGRPIDWSTSIVRALSCFLSLVVVGLGFIWIAFDDQRQGWHDKIAGTVVVRVPKGVSLL
jgi:uncharacterized RDD family membrane protein YckC